MADKKLQHSKTENMDCTARMGDSVHKAHEIATAVQELHKLNKEAEHKLHAEAKAHAETKERSKALEEEHVRIKSSIEKEKLDHENSKNRMCEIERFHSKSEAALKAKRDDLLRDMEQLHHQYVQTQGALETAANSQEEGK